MVDRRSTGFLAAAALAAGAVALALIVLGFWLRDWTLAGEERRFGEPRWWLGVLSHVGGYLALGKGGFKVATAAILGLSGAVVYLREKRRNRAVQGAGEDGAGGEERAVGS